MLIFMLLPDKYTFCKLHGTRVNNSHCEPYPNPQAPLYPWPAENVYCNVVLSLRSEHGCLCGSRHDSNLDHKTEKNKNFSNTPHMAGALLGPGVLTPHHLLVNKVINKKSKKERQSSNSSSAKIKSKTNL